MKKLLGGLVEIGQAGLEIACVVFVGWTIANCLAAGSRGLRFPDRMKKFRGRRFSSGNATVYAVQSRHYDDGVVYRVRCELSGERMCDALLTIEQGVPWRRSYELNFVPGAESALDSAIQLIVSNYYRTMLPLYGLGLFGEKPLDDSYQWN